MQAALLALGLPLLLAGCGGGPSRTSAASGLTLTVALTGPATLTAPLRTRLGKPDLPLELRLAELPNQPVAVASTRPDTTRLLADARAAYVDADLPRCLELLAGDQATVALADGEVQLAARLLFWRLACQVAAQDDAAARADAAALVSLELPLPAEVDGVSPEVEARVTAAERAAGAPARPLFIDADVESAEVSVDGRRRGCVTPCTVDVRPGDHVVRVEADGHAPAHRVVRVEPSGPRSELRLSLPPASPALAGTQWRRRAALAPDDPRTLALLASALRSRSLVLLTALPRPRGARLRGALVLDGSVVARAEWPLGAPEPQRTLRDLLVRGKLVTGERPLYRRPAFWVVVAGAAALAATVSALIVFEPEIETRLRIKP